MPAFPPHARLRVLVCSCARLYFIDLLYVTIFICKFARGVFGFHIMFRESVETVRLKNANFATHTNLNLYNLIFPHLLGTIYSSNSKIIVVNMIILLSLPYHLFISMDITRNHFQRDSTWNATYTFSGKEKDVETGLRLL